MQVLGKSRIQCLGRVRQFENKVGFAAKIKVELHFLKLLNAPKVPRDPISRNFHRYVVECDGVCSLSLT